MQKFIQIFQGIKSQTKGLAIPQTSKYNISASQDTSIYGRSRNIAHPW